MSLKKWVNGEHALYQSDAEASPLLPMSAVAVIPVEALRIRLQQKLSVSQVGSSVEAKIRSEMAEELLAELEGL